MTTAQLIAAEKQARIDGDANLQKQIDALKPPLAVAQFRPTDTVARFLQLVADETLDVIEMAAGTYPWTNVRIDIARVRPLTIRPVSGATVTFDGTGLGTVGEIFTIGYVKPVGGIRFDGSPGRFVFQDYALRQSAPVVTYWADDFEFSHVTVRSIAPYTDSSGNTEWSVYNGQRAGHRNQRLIFDDWDVAPGSQAIGGFQSYQGTDHVFVRDWKMAGVGTGFLVWGDGTDYQLGPATIDRALHSLSVQGSVKGTMTGVVATNSGAPRIATAAGMTYVGCTFDR